MEGTLSCSPLSLPLANAIILLWCESSLKWQQEMRMWANRQQEQVKDYPCLFLTYVLYPILDHVIPSLATQSISSGKLENVKRNVEDYAVNPDNSCPSPPNSFHISEAPVGVHSNQGSHLKIIELLFSFKIYNGVAYMIISICLCIIVSVVTSCATKKANTKSRPGRSINDQLRDLVTKMSAWLTVLTWRYTAAVSSPPLPLIECTPNLSWTTEIYEYRSTNNCIV